MLFRSGVPPRSPLPAAQAKDLRARAASASSPNTNPHRPSKDERDEDRTASEWSEMVGSYTFEFLSAKLVLWKLVWGEAAVGWCRTDKCPRPSGPKGGSDRTWKRKRKRERTVQVPLTIVHTVGRSAVCCRRLFVAGGPWRCVNMADAGWVATGTRC